jgi:competence protein ComFB
MDKFLAERYKDACVCPRCISDIAAIALNYLPPHYIVDTKDGKEIGSPWVMVEAAVAEAIDRVMENPNHPRVQPPDGQAEAKHSDTFRD